MSASFILWFCLTGLELKSVYTLRVANQSTPFHIIDLIQLNFSNGFSVNFDPIFELMYSGSYFVEVSIMLLLSSGATWALGKLIKKELHRNLKVGEARSVKVYRLKPHDNEFLLKSSGLITIITVLYSASSGFAVLSTVLLSFYSPIWAYNSLIMINGLVFSKAEIQLDPDISQIEDVLIITTKEKIGRFEYRPNDPMKMNLLLFNKISLIR